MSERDDLISFISQTAGEQKLRVEEDLGEGFVRLRVSEAERRQAKQDIQHVEDIVIEMLRNARDAHATTIYVATYKEEGVRTLLFLDDGDGVPADMRERIFDARVTSKLESMKMDRWGVHGRGMALYSIRQNSLEARVVESARGLGSSFKVIADTSELNERADQSKWPLVALNDEGAYACTNGPHNIVRTAIEFALESYGQCKVYLGSPTEIAASLYANSADLSAQELMSLGALDNVPLVERLSLATDAAELVEIAAELGLDISARTAQRIITSTIAPLNDLASIVLPKKAAPVQKQPLDLQKDRRGLKITPSDLETFSKRLKRDIQPLAEGYYFRVEGEPRIRVGSQRITVSFDIAQDD